MKSKLTILILGAAVAGILAGYVAHEWAPDRDTAARYASYFAILADIFLRLIKMIIAPLVFATIVSGITATGDTHAVGRIGLKALGWFITASLVSLLVGMLLANLFQPGANLNLPLPAARGRRRDRSQDRQPVVPRVHHPCLPAQHRGVDGDQRDPADSRVQPLLRLRARGPQAPASGDDHQVAHSSARSTRASRCCGAC
jgi:hypothetical protein